MREVAHGKMIPPYTDARMARLRWLRSLCSAWDQATVPSMEAPSGMLHDEYEDVLVCHSGKRWDQVDRNDARPGYAGLSWLKPHAQAYYVATYFAYGTDYLIDPDHPMAGWSPDLLEGALFACELLDQEKDILSLLSRHQCACIYEFLCGLERYAPGYRRERVRWFNRVLKPLEIQRLDRPFTKPI